MVTAVEVNKDGVVTDARPGLNGQPAGESNRPFTDWQNEYAHIPDLNERQAAILARIDGKTWTASTWWTLFVASIGFFVDSYDVFSIGLVTEMLGIVYFDGKIDDASDMSIKIATPIGTFVGQLLFGRLGDVFGRRKVYGAGLILIITATFALSITSSAPGLSIVSLFSFWRFVMGVGIGGDYPLSATIISEYASTKWRGAMVNGVFAMQGIGQLGVAIVMLIVTGVAKGTLAAVNGDPALCAQDVDCVAAVDRMWRFIIGFGAVPAICTLYFRLTMAETPRYAHDVAARQAERQPLNGTTPSPTGFVHRSRRYAKSSYRRFRELSNHRRLLKHLIGTAGAWFLLDVAFYGLSMNNPIILKSIGWTDGDNMYELFQRIAVGNLILVSAAVPGYILSACTIDIIGRKPIQLLGFGILTVLFAVISGLYWDLKPSGLLALYSLSQFFFNFGPNSTTFVYPAEVFPTIYRSTLHGTSAASGKLGAIIAQVVIFKIKSYGAEPEKAVHDIRWATPGVQIIMAVFAGIMFAGGLFTFLLPETKRKSLEELGRLDPADGSTPVVAHEMSPQTSSGDEETRA